MGRKAEQENEEIKASTAAICVVPAQTRRKRRIYCALQSCKSTCTDPYAFSSVPSIGTTIRKINEFGGALLSLLRFVAAIGEAPFRQRRRYRPRCRLAATEIGCGTKSLRTHRTTYDTSYQRRAVRCTSMQFLETGVDQCQSNALVWTIAQVYRPHLSDRGLGFPCHQILTGVT